VTEGFLSQVCEKVDAVEPIAKFTKVLQDSAVVKTGAVGTVYTKGLED
jgi:protein N-terminal methyltransferase